MCIHTGTLMIMTVILTVVSILPCACMEDPWLWNTQMIPQSTPDLSASQVTSVPQLFGNAGIRFFQIYISPADGDRCNFHPSCSEYARQSSRKHGLIIGGIMFADRFMRDHGYISHNYPVVSVNGQLLYFDPVYMNDYWWYHKKPLTEKKDP